MEEQIVFWLKENRKAFLIGGASLVLVVVLFSVLFFQERVDWGKARSEIEKNLLRMEKLEIEDRRELLALAQSMEGQFKLSPEFSPLYAGQLSQALVQNGCVEEAERLLQAQQARLPSSLPTPFSLFSESSLLIAKGELEEAWNRELALQKELADLPQEQREEGWVRTLASFNLMRRAILADLLHKDFESSALKKEMISLHKSGDKSIGALVEAYKIGSKDLVGCLRGELPRLASEGTPDL